MIRRFFGGRIFGFLGGEEQAPPGTEFITTETPENIQTETGENFLTEGL